MEHVILNREEKKIMLLTNLYRHEHNKIDIFYIPYMFTHVYLSSSFLHTLPNNDCKKFWYKTSRNTNSRKCILSANLVDN